jgi:hypothetical protein
MRGDAMSPDVLEGLRVFFREIVKDALQEAVREVSSERQTPRYATSKHNPLGTARSFLNAARANKFKTFKRGRETAAKWDDVAAYVESTARTKRKKSAPGDFDIDRLFDETFSSRRGRRA